MEYGYVRVSSLTQNIDRQMDQMHRLHLSDDAIFVDHYSGKDFQREAYQAMLHILKPGDVVYISAIDRLGRNYEMITEEWRRITRVIKADICVLDMPLLDTRKSRNLVGSLLSDVVLQILSYVAEEDRNHIRQRQAEGIRVAKEQGIHLGRPKFEITPKFHECAERYIHQDMTSTEAAKCLGISRGTFYKYMKEHGYERPKEMLKVIPNARGRKKSEKER